MKNLSELWENIKLGFVNFLPSLAAALGILIVGIVLAIIAVRVTKKALLHKKIDYSLTMFICRCARILIYIITLLAALSALNISIAGLIAFFTAAAAAVALALKDRLSDIASGIVILFSKPFVTGDFIEFGSHSGYVQKIDVMHTDILTLDGTNVIVPNSVISNSELNNYTAHPIVRVTVNVPIPYEVKIDEVKEILYSVIKSTELTVTDESHKPVVRLEKFGESSLDFTVRVFCDFKDYWTVYYDLTEHIKAALDENGISIPFNQLDVHMVN